jgi:hypothetical protein
VRLGLPAALAIAAILPAAARPAQSASRVPAFAHVVVIVFENKEVDQIAGNASAPTFNGLGRNGARLDPYRAVAHPSLPNYLALTSGSTWGITDDNYHALPSGEDLGSELTSAAISWRAYMEDMTGGCFDSQEPYALKHNPFAYYGGQCPSNVVPLSQLEADLSGNTPNFVWITPNRCHDEHSCSVSEGDWWLSEIVPKIIDSEAWTDDGVLFIVWDEDDKESGANRVPLIVVASNLKKHQTDAYYDHYFLLATIQDRLGVKRLGEADNAQAIEDLFQQ